MISYRSAVRLSYNHSINFADVSRFHPLPVVLRGYCWRYKTIQHSADIYGHSDESISEHTADSSLQIIAGPKSLPDFPVPDKTGQKIGFVDAAQANDLCRWRSTTGYAFLLNFGNVSYHSKTQLATATSSIKTEFLVAVTRAKHTKCLHAVLLELGCPQQNPTTLYEDSMFAINMINNRVPTEQSCHINI